MGVSELINIYKTTNTDTAKLSIKLVHNFENMRKVESELVKEQTATKTNHGGAEETAVLRNTSEITIEYYASET